MTYTGGIFYANLLDFTGDGIPELLLAYCAGIEEYSLPEYQTELWTWEVGTAKQIYQSVGYLPYLVGDSADQSLVIAHKDGNVYLVKRDAGESDDIEFLGWNGTEFASVIRFEYYWDYLPYEYGINSEAVTEQEYTELRSEWPEDVWPEWEENWETYAPYGLIEGKLWYNDDNSAMLESARQAIADTKAVLGLEDSGPAEGTETAMETVQALKKLVDQYNDFLNGDVSYYDLDGAEITRAEAQDGVSAVASDCFLEFLGFYGSYNSTCFDGESGYFTLSKAEREAAAAEGTGLYYALYDVNGDSVPELVLSGTHSNVITGASEREIISIWAVQDGAPVKVCAAMYRYPLVLCNDGAILRYGVGGVHEHTYAFYSFNSLLRGGEELLEQYTIAYDENIWDHTTYTDVGADLDWVAFGS